MPKQTANTLAFWKHCFNILENGTSQLLSIFKTFCLVPQAGWWLTVFEHYPILPWPLTPGTQEEGGLSLLRSALLKVPGLGKEQTKLELEY